MKAILTDTLATNIHEFEAPFVKKALVPIVEVLGDNSSRIFMFKYVALDDGRPVAIYRQVSHIHTIQES